MPLGEKKGLLFVCVTGGKRNRGRKRRSFEEESSLPRRGKSVIKRDPPCPQTGRVSRKTIDSIAGSAAFPEGKGKKKRRKQSEGVNKKLYSKSVDVGIAQRSSRATLLPEK